LASSQPRLTETIFSGNIPNSQDNSWWIGTASFAGSASSAPKKAWRAWASSRSTRNSWPRRGRLQADSPYAGRGRRGSRSRAGERNKGKRAGAGQGGAGGPLPGSLDDGNGGWV